MLRTNWLKQPYYEELSLAPEHVNLGRLNAGAPLLNSHRSDDLKSQIGVVEKAWISDGKGHARLRFSRRDDVEPVFQDVKDGIIRGISVGYRVHKTEERKEEKGAEFKTIRALDWEPHELSLVAVGADSGATVRTLGGEEEAQMEEKAKDHEAVLHERQRVKEILNLSKRFAVSEEKSDAYIANNVSLDQIRSEILANLAHKSEEQEVKTTPIEMLRDERETRQKGMTNAILHRHDPSIELSENGQQYRLMSLFDMARTNVKESNFLGKEEIVTRAFHSTSDFPLILGNVAKQKLLASYERLVRKQNFWPLVKIRSTPDFKPMRTVRIGELPNLSPLPEGAEYSYGTLGESADEYRISTYGKAMAITRQMVINDDLGALDSLGNWGAAIARLEAGLFWDIFNTNPKLADGTPLFHAGHNNKDAAKPELSIDALSKARIAMAKQQGLDKRDGDYLDLQAEYLIVPIELQTKAEQFLSRETVPQSPNEVNPFKGAFKLISTTWIKDPKAWYLASSASQGVDLIEMAYLDGKRQPYVEWHSDFNTDSVRVKVRYDVGAKAIDYRGLYQGGAS